jgi:hypothetical protein
MLLAPGHQIREESSWSCQRKNSSIGTEET